MEKWEKITSQDPGHEWGARTERLKVFEGWIVKSVEGNHHSQCMVFIPDENHDWEIEPEVETPETKEPEVEKLETRGALR